MKYLGIDFGTKRIGVAISDEGGALAFPRAVWENNETFFERLQEIVKKEGIGKIVVGIPRALSGKETAMTEQVKKFIEELKQKICSPALTQRGEPARQGFIVVEEDEVFSTKIAKENAREDMRDASAAALILQQYLNRD